MAARYFYNYQIDRYTWSELFFANLCLRNFFRFRQDPISKCICRNGICWPSIWNGWVCRGTGQRWTLCITQIRCPLCARTLLRCCKWILVFGFRRWWRRRWRLRSTIIRRKLSQCKSSITYDATSIITRALWHVTAHGCSTHEHYTPAITADELISRWKH